MPRYKMIVMSNPVAGREAEYNDWYQNVHLDQMLALKGVGSAQRFRLARNLGQGATHAYAAIYEIETDDLDALLQEIQARAGSERLLISESIDTDGAVAAIYETFGPEARKK